MSARSHPRVQLVRISVVAIVLQLAGRIDAIKFSLGPCFLQYLEPCSEEVIQFYLFSSERPHRAPIVLNARQPELPDYVDLTRDTTKVIVHGYGGNVDFYATKTIRDGE